MNAADLSTLEAGAAISRDIFMVGVYTAQRISDYNNIRREDIHTTTKRCIEDVPDEENPGHTTPEMLKRYIKADQLDVVQKLTDKYNYFD